MTTVVRDALIVQHETLIVVDIRRHLLPSIFFITVYCTFFERFSPIPAAKLIDINYIFVTLPGFCE